MKELINLIGKSGSTVALFFGNLSMISSVSVSRVSWKEKVSCLGYRWLILFIDASRNFELFLSVQLLSLRAFVRFVKYLLRS